MGAIAANDIELGDLLVLDKIDNLLEIKASTRAPQHRASFVMNVLHYIRGQNKWLQMWSRVVESSITPLNAIHGALDAVELVQRFRNLTDHVV